MEIIKERSRGLLIFLIPTLIITTILFILMPPSPSMLVGFIVLMVFASITYYLGVNRSLKKKEIDYLSIIIFVVPTIIISIIIFSFEDLLVWTNWISIIGLGVLLTTFCFSFYSAMKDAAG